MAYPPEGTNNNGYGLLVTPMEFPAAVMIGPLFATTRINLSTTRGPESTFSFP